MGLDGAKSDFGADEAYPIESFPEKIHEYLEKVDRLYYGFGSDEKFDEKIIDLFKTYNRRRIRHGKGPNSLIDSTEILAEMRTIKNDEEVNRIRFASAATVGAHCAAMKAARPGMYEYELEAIVESTFRKSCGGRPAFPTIVAAGPNATTLHYTANNQQIHDGDLVLVDAGCEYKYYSGDVTRTFPANGKFSSPQREIYELVLEVQLAVVETIRPGNSIGEPNRKAIDLLTDGMLTLGLLDGKKKTALAEKTYSQFFMHQVGHMLGLDVHDVNNLWNSQGLKKFAPGMIITVEPGIYVYENAEKVPEKYLGLGVRIEDAILVTESGAEILTAGAPKEIDEIEAFMRDGRDNSIRCGGS